MKSQRTQQPKHGEGKCGRPGNLSQLGPSSLLTEAIAPLPFARLNDPDWFVRASTFALGCLRESKPVSQAGLLPAMGGYIEDRIARFSETPMSKWFRPARSGALYPDLRATRNRRQRAIELSGAMLRVARHNPELVRTATLAYVFGASGRGRVLLVDPEDAVFGRAIIDLVDELNVRWLSWNLKAFGVGEREPDTDLWPARMGLRRRPTIEVVNARTTNEFELEHLGIDIQRAGRNSREFREVALLAATIWLWHTVTPLLGGALDLAEEQQCLLLAG